MPATRSFGKGLIAPWRLPVTWVCDGIPRLDFRARMQHLQFTLESGHVRLLSYCACSLPSATDCQEVSAMAKATTIKIRLVSTADTGHFYVTKKNARTMTDKLTIKKYDPVARKHVEYKESKIK